MSLRTDPDAALQVAVFNALTGYAPLAAALGAPAADRVLDAVPTDKTGKITGPFPYLVIGEDHIVGRGQGCADPSDCHVKVELWTRTQSFLGLKQLAGHVRNALGCRLPLVGHQVATWRFEETLYMREADGITRRAIVQLVYRTSPTA